MNRYRTGQCLYCFKDYTAKSGQPCEHCGTYFHAEFKRGANKSAPEVLEEDEFGLSDLEEAKEIVNMCSNGLISTQID